MSIPQQFRVRYVAARAHSVAGSCVRAEGAFGDIIWVNCGQLETANSKQVCCSRFVCVRRVHSVTRHVVIDTPVSSLYKGWIYHTQVFVFVFAYLYIFT